MTATVPGDLSEAAERRGGIFYVRIGDGRLGVMRRRPRSNRIARSEDLVQANTVAGTMADRVFSVVVAGDARTLWIAQSIHKRRSLDA